MTTQKSEHQRIIECIKQVELDLTFHHLTTRSYAEHMALNFAYDAIHGLFDTISESLIGHAGRITGFKAVVPSCELLETPKCVKECSIELKEYATKEKLNDLINIADEMFAVGAKLQYLLTLD